MAVSADTLRMHLDYSAWASGRLLETAAKLSGDELLRDFQTADKNVRDTLAHIFGADRIWLARVEGNSPGLYLTEQDRDFPTLQREWPALHKRWGNWAAPLSDESALEVIAYRDLKGNAWQQPLWQIILHVVNHATHHRGMVSGFLRTMGHTPPPLDLIAYYRAL